MIKMLRYSNLLETQKKEICNGCGSKGGWIKPPNFIFKASCNQHDFYYWRGCDDTSRELADDSFYKYMRIDISEREYGFFKAGWYHTWAWSYYKAVRIFGKKAFYYAESMRDEDDLETEITSKLESIS